MIQTKSTSQHVSTYYCYETLKSLILMPSYAACRPYNISGSPAFRVKYPRVSTVSDPFAKKLQASYEVRVAIRSSLFYKVLDFDVLFNSRCLCVNDRF
jgi:hypothetical protein